MKKIILLFSVAITALCIALSCSKSENEPANQPSFLTNAHQLAHDVGGFYVKTSEIKIRKDSVTGGKVLNLSLSDPSVKPHAINVFLNETDWNDIDIESGKFELLFLKHALLIHDPMTDLQYSFVVKNDELKELEEVLPKNYLSKNRIGAIGIAIYGDHNPHRLLTR